MARNYYENKIHSFLSNTSSLGCTDENAFEYFMALEGMKLSAVAKSRVHSEITTAINSCRERSLAHRKNAVQKKTSHTSHAHWRSDIVEDDWRSPKE